MKHILLLAAFAFTGLLSFAQTENRSRDKDAEKRDVKGFHAIEVSGGIDLYLSQGEETVAISASDASVRDRIQTVVENGILKIYMEHSFHGNRGLRKLKAYVSFKILDALKASGGSDIYAEEGLKMDKLDLALSGGSGLKGKVDIRDLAITQSGGSDVHITGMASNLSVHASGGSDLHGYDLTTDICHVASSGGSDIQITVNKELNVFSSGGSDVYYKGSCSVRQVKTSGGSDVIRKG